MWPTFVLEQWLACMPFPVEMHATSFFEHSGTQRAKTDNLSIRHIVLLDDAIGHHMTPYWILYMHTTATGTC